VSAVFSLKGKKALITGAGSSSGIGFTSATALKQLGAEVIITSTSNRIFDRATEIQALGLVADLCDERQVKELFSNIDSLDILVNNAGMTSISNPAENSEAGDVANIELSNWRLGMARNLDSAFLVTKYALPLLRKSKSGRIVMISSVTGAIMAMKNQPIYASAKAAMVGLTKALALDEAKNSITCNAILPGWIATDSISDKEKEQGRFVPLGRGGRAEEVTAAVAFLVSEEASYITGQSIVVDGGNSIMEERF
jgi:3-oxoacyl-[acyl-carrier protein] reductase